MAAQTPDVAITRRLDAKIWAIAWPAILANLSIPLLGVVDAALLGHLDSPHHLAAVALGAAILSFLYWGFGFLRMGTSGEVARASGSGDEARALLALGRASVLAVVLAGALWILQAPLLRLGLLIMGPEPALGETAYRYGQLRLLSAPAVLLTYTLLGWFIGHQDTRWPMRVVIATNLLNIGLDALFILGLNLASAGAALATVTAEYLGLAVALYGLKRHGLPRVSRRVWAALARIAPYLSTLRSNADLFLRTLALLFAFAFFTAAGEKLGAEVVAANAVMMQFLLFAAFALDGFAYAAEGLAGEALGSGNTARFYAVSARCALWTAICAALISLTIMLGREAVFPLLSDLPAILSLMREHGFWLVLLPAIAAPSYLLDGLFIGAGATRIMMLSMLFSTCVVYLPAWYLAQPLGNHGLWLAFTLFNATRGITLGLAYRRFTRRNRWARPAGSPV